MNKLPLVFILAIVFWSCERDQRSVYILPEGFIGYVIVLHDQPDGQPEEYEDGRYIYRVNSNGFLKTQVQTKEDWGAKPSFFYGKISPTTEITVVDAQELNTTDVNVYGFGHGSIYSRGSETATGYAQFFVSSEAEVDSLTESFERLDLVDLLSE